MDILAQSDIGVIVLNKEPVGSSYNRVGGVDANFRRGFLSLDAYAVKTASPQSEVPGEGEDFAARGGWNYQSRTWGFRGFFSVIGERFNDEMGFIQRIGVNNTNFDFSRTFRPSWLSKFGIRETRPHWRMDNFVRRDGTGLDSRYQDVHLPFNFNDGGFVETGVNPNVEDIRVPFTISGVLVKPGRYSFNEYFVLWNSNNSARFSVNARFSNGGFYDGSRRGYTFGPSVRLNERFNASVNLQVNDVELSTGSVVTTLVSTRVNYNFTTRAFLNALVQYNTDSKQLSSNIRFNLIHRPLSDLFVVYNERYDERTNRTDRAFIVKMTYLVAF
jgi:hypothetical protein